jgi:alcohol dehydrogenase (cytochrome c)
LFLIAVLSVSFGVPLRFGRRSVAASPAPADEGDWMYADHDFNGTRYSPLTQITPANAKQLTKVCSYTFPEKVPSESTPIVVAGVLYATSDHYTVALDAADCHVLWSYQWVPRDTDSVHPHRGASLANGKLIRGTGDDYLISLDAETGKLLWAKQIADPKAGYFISMPALVTNDTIYVGPAGSERAGSGWMGAFRLSDGQQLWKFNIIPQDGEPGADTWGPNPEARKHAGGALWTPQSYDSEKGILYVAGGNPAPDFWDRCAARRQSLHQFHDRAGWQDGEAALVQPVHPPRRRRLRHHARESDFQSQFADHDRLVRQRRSAASGRRRYA